MNKILLGALLALAPMAAQTCVITSFSPQSVVHKVIDENLWALEGYDKICTTMEKANAAFMIHGDATVLSGVSIGWANIGLRDRELPVYSDDLGRRSIRTNTNAGMDIAETLLHEAIMSAVQSMELGRALETLDAARAEVRSAR